MNEDDFKEIVKNPKFVYRPPQYPDDAPLSEPADPNINIQPMIFVGSTDKEIQEILERK